MTTLKQIEANRRNAQNSTGPRTEAGKERSSRNAVRHGLTAETVIEPLEAQPWRLVSTGKEPAPLSRGCTRYGATRRPLRRGSAAPFESSGAIAMKGPHTETFRRICSIVVARKGGASFAPSNIGNELVKCHAIAGQQLH